MIPCTVTEQARINADCWVDESPRRPQVWRGLHRRVGSFSCSRTARHQSTGWGATWRSVRSRSIVPARIRWRRRPLDDPCCDLSCKPGPPQAHSVAQCRRAGPRDSFPCIDRSSSPVREQTAVAPYQTQMELRQSDRSGPPAIPDRATDKFGFRGQAGKRPGGRRSRR